MSHSTECRIVTETSRGRFANDYKATIHQIQWFGRTRWQVQAWQRWPAHSLSWSRTVRLMRRHKTPEGARAAANKWLDTIERNNDEGECV